MKTKIYLSILSTLIFISCENKQNSTDSATIETVAAIDVSEIQSDSTANIAKKSNWEYTEEKDEMTDKMCYMAATESLNAVEFGFPYEGGSKLFFIIRDSPQFGKDMYMIISRGQFMTHYNGTKITVRFDDKEAFTVKCAESSDSDTGILFVENYYYKKMLEQLKSSDTMKINAEFFHEGTRTFTFDISGLEWDH